jgi:hypothetical protein
MTINLNPEYLASLRKSAEHMRDHGLALQDVRGEVTLALLDALHEARTDFLKLHQHDLQIACNEREELRARVKELEGEISRRDERAKSPHNAEWHAFQRGDMPAMVVHLPRIQAYHADISQGGTMLILERGVSLWVASSTDEVRTILERVDA